MTISYVRGEQRLDELAPESREGARAEPRRAPGGRTLHPPAATARGALGLAARLAGPGPIDLSPRPPARFVDDRVVVRERPLHDRRGPTLRAVCSILPAGQGPRRTHQGMRCTRTR